jgi:primosomal protein N' (replication factor Y)
MSKKVITYVDVILPVSVPNLYTYHYLNEEGQEDLFAGMRVCVQFGKRKLYTAIVAQVHKDPPIDYETKPLVAILDNYPVIFDWQLKFWKWITDYYMCTPGDIFNAAMPSGLRPEGQSQLYLENFPENGLSLSGIEENLVLLIEKNPGITITGLSQLAERKNIMPVIKGLMDKKIVALDENLKVSWQPKKITLLKLHDNLVHEEVLGELLNKLERRAPKQLEVLMIYLELSGYLKDKTIQSVNKSLIGKRKSISPATIKTLIEKEVFTVEEQEVSRLPQDKNDTVNKVILNEHQKKALSEIKLSFKQKDIVLLHGVTSSGKTEIYVHLIEEQLKLGKQVLYLLPEIALTTQIIDRLRNVFGDMVGVYHSKFSNAERVEVWNNLRGKNPGNVKPYKVILGVRSSVFLPFTDLGLVIVDEEHENTYKQYDPAPRYHARDTAIVLAGMHKAKVLLGTATPSLESIFNAKTKKYGYVALTKRHLDIQLPKISVSNIAEARKKKLMSGHFTPLLVSEVQQSLSAGEQIILFQNRRGFSPYLECNDCAWIPTCKYCDVSLTYHKGINKQICHYCGFSMNSVVQCKACGSHNIQTRGFGTEKVEDDIKVLFPEARIQRMDLDSTRKKKAYEQIIDGFSSGEIDILIGTQMVSKGLDFDNVSVVGILNADNMLNFPDFRAHERSFQLMAQVSGRAGRKKKRGKVIIQTNDPKNPIIQYVIENDFSSFFRGQLTDRKRFYYPPYFRLIRISVRHRDKQVLNTASRQLSEILRKEYGNRVLGPETPVVGRVQNWHIKHILIKLEKNKEIAEWKNQIREICDNLKNKPGYSTLQIIYDVDPM